MKLIVGVQSFFWDTVYNESNNKKPRFMKPFSDTAVDYSTEVTHVEAKPDSIY